MNFKNRTLPLLDRKNWSSAYSTKLIWTCTQPSCTSSPATLSPGDASPAIHATQEIEIVHTMPYTRAPKPCDHLSCKYDTAMEWHARLPILRSVRFSNLNLKKYFFVKRPVLVLVFKLLTVHSVCEFVMVVFRIRIVSLIATSDFVSCAVINYWWSHVAFRATASIALSALRLDPLLLSKVFYSRHGN